MKTRVILTTHPHTQWTLEGRYQGHIDVPLCPIGISMAEKLVDRLSNEPISCVYSSDLQRSFQTGEIIADSKGVKHITDIRLREGRWERQEDHYEFPVLSFRENVEEHNEVLERMFEMMTEIAGNHEGETVFVVSHWGVTNVFITYILKHDHHFHEKYLGRLAAVNIFECENGAWSCVCLNDDEFLGGLRISPQ